MSTKPRIWTFIPHCYSDEPIALAAAYNRFMELIPDGDWGLLLDHDTFFTHKNWYRECEHAIEQHPDAGLFTVKQVLSQHRKHLVRVRDNYYNPDAWDSIKKHQGAGVELYNAKKGQTSIIPVTKISGYFMLIKKAIWLQVIDSLPAGMNKVDHSIGKAIAGLGYKMYYIDSLYMCHYGLRKC